MIYEIKLTGEDIKKSKKKIKSKERESDITKQIRDYLKIRQVFHWKQIQGLGSAKGVSDILGIYKGKPLAIEVKTSKGKLSENQIYFLQNFKREGGIAFVARSVEDVEKNLRLEV